MKGDNSKNKEQNCPKTKSDSKSSTKRKQKKKELELVVASSEDLAEVVTETVTKLLAEDVLKLEDDGTIDLKSNDEFIDKVKKKGKDKKDKEK